MTVKTASGYVNHSEFHCGFLLLKNKERRINLLSYFKKLLKQTRGK